MKSRRAEIRIREDENDDDKVIHREDNKCHKTITQYVFAAIYMYIICVYVYKGLIRTSTRCFYIEITHLKYYVKSS